MRKQTILTIALGIFLLFAVIGLMLPGDRSEITGNTISEQTGQSASQDSVKEKAFVSKVIDGDTVIVNGESVRLLGMDTDERGYPCYNEAKKRIEELILDKEVILEKDAEDRDQYGRILRYIFLDGKNINLQLVEEGFAVARFYPENQKYKAEILESEKYARDNKLGCKWREEKVEAEVNILEQEETKTETKEQETIDTSKYICNEEAYNCGDFKTHAEAQAVFNACGGVNNDVHGLDRDSDGDPCETLA